MSGPFTTRDGNEYDVYRPATGTRLPPKTFVLQAAPMRGYYLSLLEDLRVPTRIYGQNHGPRIMRAYAERAAQGISTGVWLNGEKGSGKTMLAAVLSQEMRKTGLPTILIRNSHHGEEFNSLVEHIGEACFIFDEFEKTYDEDNEKNALLTVFSGAVVARHLYILTTNDQYKVASAMRNRPSRMRYFIDHRGLGEDVVQEYVQEKLTDKSMVDKVVQALKQVPECNFDIMMCCVEEHNRLGGDIKELLAIMNVTRDSDERKWTFEYQGKDHNGAEIVGQGMYRGDPERVVEQNDSLRVIYFDKDKRKVCTHVDFDECEAQEDLSIILRGSMGVARLKAKYEFSNWRQRF